MASLIWNSAVPCFRCLQVLQRSSTGACFWIYHFSRICAWVSASLQRHALPSLCTWGSRASDRLSSANRRPSAMRDCNSARQLNCTLDYTTIDVSVCEEMV